MSMTLELLPCPFCGTDDHETSPWPSRKEWVCNCGNPDCAVEVTAETPQEAIAKWNRRSNLAQPAQSVDVGAIREVIAEMREFEDYPALIRLRKAADKLTRAIAVESDGWSVPDDVMKDAARYQWLRISANISWNEWVTYENLMASDRERDEMDAAIDRAIAITYAPTPPTDGEE